MRVTVRGKTVKIIECENPVSAEQVLRESGIGFSMPCGGNHTCGKCRIRVNGSVSEMTAEEKKLLGEAEENERLACFVTLTGDCEIITGGAKTEIMTEGFRSDYGLDPIGEGCGIAVDIGTTTVAVYLYDLKTGSLKGKEAFSNPQAAFGGDVISRIEESLAGKGKELKEAVTAGIAKAAETVCKRAGVSVGLCRTAVITGNTTMLYLFLGKDVACLSAAPFEIEDYLGRFTGETELSEKIRLNIYLPRTMSAFVGSDITCALVSAADIMKSEKASLLIDIGTNGEMAVIKDGSIFCCSTAAGPAFEGAGIHMGCMAVPGAVNKVTAENGRIEYTTIAGEKPCGICGSGIIDAVAVFISVGLIDETGCIAGEDTDYSGYVTELEGQPAVKIGDSGIVLTQKDVRAVQLAKAAIRAGVESLLNACGETADGIGKLVLAGGFGSYIDIKSAAGIGLIPRELADKTVAVGNAAGMGAVSVLLSRRAMEYSDEIAGKAVTLELSTSEFFMDNYVEHMMFM